MPRPEYRPLPEPRPRPTRLRSLRGCAGLRFERLSSGGFDSGISDLLHPDEVADLPQHALQRGGDVVLPGLADAAEPERTQRAAVTRRLPDRAARLGEPKPRHPKSPRHSCPLARKPAPPRPPRP